MLALCGRDFKVFYGGAEICEWLIIKFRVIFLEKEVENAKVHW